MSPHNASISDISGYSKNICVWLWNKKWCTKGHRFVSVRCLFISPKRGVKRGSLVSTYRWTRQRLAVTCESFQDSKLQKVTTENSPQKNISTYSPVWSLYQRSWPSGPFLCTCILRFLRSIYIMKCIFSKRRMVQAPCCAKCLGVHGFNAWCCWEWPWP